MRRRGSRAERKVRARLAQNNWLEDGLIRPLNQLPSLPLSLPVFFPARRRLSQLSPLVHLRALRSVPLFKNLRLPSSLRRLCFPSLVFSFLFFYLPSRRCRHAKKKEKEKPVSRLDVVFKRLLNSRSDSRCTPPPLHPTTLDPVRPGWVLAQCAVPYRNCLLVRIDRLLLDTVGERKCSVDYRSLVLMCVR